MNWGFSNTRKGAGGGNSRGQVVMGREDHHGTLLGREQKEPFKSIDALVGPREGARLMMLSSLLDTEGIKTNLRADRSDETKRTLLEKTTNLFGSFFWSKGGLQDFASLISSLAPLCYGIGNINKRNSRLFTCLGNNPLKKKNQRILNQINEGTRENEAFRTLVGWSMCPESRTRILGLFDS